MQPFPPVEQAAANGLLAIGGDLSEARLLAAYRRGIFPWYEQGQPILWWSPEPRCVLFPDELKISRSLKKSLRRAACVGTFDTAFAAVIAACAAPRARGAGTWITAAMRRAYTNLHNSGYAHSAEIWRRGKLIGGLYGVSLGRVFFGESMFSREADASKMALAMLVARLREWKFEMIDCQIRSAHLISLGAAEIPRAEFVKRLQRAVELPAPAGRWSAANWSPRDAL